MAPTHTHRLSQRAGWCCLALLALLQAAEAAPRKPAAPAPAVPQDPQLELIYLTQDKELPPPLSNQDPIPADLGVQGARLAVVDNNTTGRFTHQRFSLKEIRVPQDGDLAAAYRQAAGNGPQHVIAKLPAAALLALADLPEAADDLIYNTAAPDDALRNEQCRANLLHLIPSRAMRADALAQYLLAKRWKTWLLVEGPEASDKLLAAAYQRAAKRFGNKIAEKRQWAHDYDARRSAQSEVATFTQGVDYDVLVVADEAGQFGDYLSYRTWLPRPVAGTQGLAVAAWHRTHEQWGAVQLQNRFRTQTGRWMGDEDYAAWLAVRAVGEAATRSHSLAHGAIRDYLRNDAFALAGFKGKPLSFRAWDGQLRQPILLADSRSLVAVAPIEGFLHPKNEMDTLGFDEAESLCRAKPAEAGKTH
jgi:ABC transporter substrate binding protein (PQQ-dependent alcohol dehydrogenase system)